MQDNDNKNNGLNSVHSFNSVNSLIHKFLIYIFRDNLILPLNSYVFKNKEKTLEQLDDFVFDDFKNEDLWLKKDDSSYAPSFLLIFNILNNFKTYKPHQSEFSTLIGCLKDASNTSSFLDLKTFDQYLIIVDVNMLIDHHLDWINTLKKDIINVTNIIQSIKNSNIFNNVDDFMFNKDDFIVYLNELIDLFTSLKKSWTFFNDIMHKNQDKIRSKKEILNYNEVFLLQNIAKNFKSKLLNIIKKYNKQDEIIEETQNKDQTLDGSINGKIIDVIDDIPKTNYNDAYYFSHPFDKINDGINNLINRFRLKLTGFLSNNITIYLKEFDGWFDNFIKDGSLDIDQKNYDRLSNKILYLKNMQKTLKKLQVYDPSTELNFSLNLKEKINTNKQKDDYDDTLSFNFDKASLNDDFIKNNIQYKNFVKYFLAKDSFITRQQLITTEKQIIENYLKDLSNKEYWKTRMDEKQEELMNLNKFDSDDIYNDIDISNDHITNLLKMTDFLKVIYGNEFKEQNEIYYVNSDNKIKRLQNVSLSDLSFFFKKEVRSYQSWLIRFFMQLGVYDVFKEDTIDDIKKNKSR